MSLKKFVSINENLEINKRNELLSIGVIQSIIKDIKNNDSTTHVLIESVLNSRKNLNNIIKSAIINPYYKPITLSMIDTYDYFTKIISKEISNDNINYINRIKMFYIVEDAIKFNFIKEWPEFTVNFDFIQYRNYNDINYIKLK